MTKNFIWKDDFQKILLKYVGDYESMYFDFLNDYELSL